jgi:hypothetical protein
MEKMISINNNMCMRNNKIRWMMTEREKFKIIYFREFYILYILKIPYIKFLLIYILNFITTN